MLASFADMTIASGAGLAHVLTPVIAFTEELKYPVGVAGAGNVSGEYSAGIDVGADWVLSERRHRCRSRTGIATREDYRWVIDVSVAWVRQLEVRPVSVGIGKALGAPPCEASAQRFDRRLDDVEAFFYTITRASCRECDGFGAYLP